MSPEVNTWLQLIIRWAHVVAGVTWIGHLYFFNWVNGPFAKTLGDEKKKIIPELAPRALFWFRWGAAWTWITGVLLLGLVYYMGGVLFENPGAGNMALAGGLLVAVFFAAFLYDVIMRVVPNVIAANTLSLVLLCGMYALLKFVGGYGGRALYIHVGVMFGTAMAMNVWMRIWPAQKKIIPAIKEGTAPDAALAAMATLRSRHNTFMSVPLIFLMVSNHYPTIYGSGNAEIYLAIIIAVGFIMTKMLYGKAAKIPAM